MKMVRIIFLISMPFSMHLGCVEKLFRINKIFNLFYIGNSEVIICILNYCIKNTMNVLQPPNKNEQCMKYIYLGLHSCVEIAYSSHRAAELQ